VFPQFGADGPLPKHGLARDQAWQPLRAPQRDAAVLAFGTTIGPTADWPHTAQLTLTGAAAAAQLVVRLAVRNVGAAPLPFTAALHPYLAVATTATARLTGLAGQDARDARGGARPLRLGPEPWPVAGPCDLLVPGAPGPLALHAPPSPPLHLAAHGFGDWVVWNPGPGHGLADVAAGDETRFVCVEPACLTVATIEPGASWEGVLTLTSGD
jgi:glucose-6-phosphate 1-epimerase